MTHNYGGYGSRGKWRQAFDIELAKGDVSRKLFDNAFDAERWILSQQGE